jgi:multiple sugar transport system substrate-binding protein
MAKMGKAIGVICIAASILSACSGGSKENVGNDTGKSTPDNSASMETAEIVFYSQNGATEKSFNDLFGDSLRKKFPNYTFKFIERTGKGTYLADLMAAKTHFDIYFASVGHYEYDVFPFDFQYDMTELIKKHKVDLNRLDQSMISGVEASSHGIYALPVMTNAMVLYYNKTIFDKFGVSYPKDGMTWDEINELSRKVTRKEGDVQYIGYAPFPNYMIYMNPLSIPNIDKSTLAPTINQNDAWKKFFQSFFVTPVEIPGVRDYLLQAKDHIVNQFMYQKDVAMLPYVSGLIPAWTELLGSLDWDIVSVPTFKESPGVGAQPYSVYYGITKMAKNKDAAMKVLDYMLSDEIQKGLARTGNIPVIKSEATRKELGQDTVFKNKNWGAVFYNKMAQVPYKGSYDVQIAAIYGSYGTQVMQGKLDVNTALRKAEEDALKKIQELQKQ